MRRVPFLVVCLAVACSTVAGIIYTTTSSHTHSYQDDRQKTAHTGAITGRVVDTEGKPIAGAMVYADCDGSPLGRRPDALTDEQGVFSFKNLTPGIYIVSADKEEDGYPPSGSNFYAFGTAHTLRVDVYEGQTTSDVVVRLTQKAARLRGKVVDNVSGRSIMGTEISVCRVDMPYKCYRTSLNLPEEEGAFDLLVPPVPVTVEITAPGYEKWEKESVVKLDLHDLKRLNITLRRVK